MSKVKFLTGDEIPISHIRNILIYNGRDEERIKKYEQCTDNPLIKLTRVICNGYYHSYRRMLSFFDIDCRIKFYTPYFSAILQQKPWENIDTINQSQDEVVLLKAPNSRHFSMTEIKYHYPMTILYNGSASDIVPIIRAFERNPYDSKIINDSDIVLTATMEVWDDYLNHQATDCTTEVYSEIQALRNSIYPPASKPICVSGDD